MEEEKMKLNLGSGISGALALNVIALDHTGWKNIDICPENNPHECYDITTGIREADDSVEMIWMGDFLEHLMRVKSEFVLKECYRVMQSGGKIIVSVPDMEVVMPLWLKSNGEDTEHAQLIWGCQGGKFMRNALAQSHFNGFTKESLASRLKEAGFTKTARIGVHKHWCELAMEAYK
jgi:Methyltransferase domain